MVCKPHSEAWLGQSGPGDVRQGESARVWVGTRGGGEMSAFKCILCTEMSVSLYVSWVM